MHVNLNFGDNFDKLADFSPSDSWQEMPRFSFPDCSMTRRQTKSDPISSFLFQDFRSQSILEESSRVSKVAQLKMSGWSPVAISASAQRYITSKSVWFSKKISSYSIHCKVDSTFQVYFDQGKWTFHLGIFFLHTPEKIGLNHSRCEEKPQFKNSRSNHIIERKLIQDFRGVTKTRWLEIAFKSLLNCPGVNFMVQV